VAQHHLGGYLCSIADHVNRENTFPLIMHFKT
jgi:hypothetical protein